MAMTRPDRVRGAGHDDFWEGCARDLLCLPRCRHCGHLQWPVAEICEQCDAADFAFEAVSGRGRIVSWATFVHDYYKGAFGLPYDTILVALEEGPLFLSNPSGFGGSEIMLDQAVVVTFVDAEDGGGQYRLPLFARA